MSFSANTQILRLPQLCARLGIARSTVYDKLSPTSPRYDATFPRPIKLGLSSVGWLECSVQDWIQSRIEIGHTKNR